MKRGVFLRNNPTNESFRKQKETRRPESARRGQRKEGERAIKTRRAVRDKARSDKIYDF